MNIPVNLLAFGLFVVSAICFVALKLSDTGGEQVFGYTMAASAGAVLGVSVPGGKP